MNRLPISGNVPAEIAERLSDVTQHPEEFDEYLDEHFFSVVPQEIAKPLQQLLLTLRQINQVDRIGGLNKERALEWLRRDGEAIREACAQVWRDL